MSTSAGRPVSSFITDNFNRGGKVDNKSGRYYWSCKHCPNAPRIQGRDNQLPNHLIYKCKKCSSEIRKQARTFVMDKSGGPDAVEFINSDKIDASSTTEGISELVTPGKRKKHTLSGFVDCPLTKEQHSRANVKLLQFIIDANIAFSASENEYLLQFLDEIRPSYTAPSRYMMSHTMLDTEAVRVQQEEIDRLKVRKRLTLLLHGWEDLLKRSLYGSVAVEVKQLPVVLALEDMTGNRGTADNLLVASKKAMKTMEIDDGKCIIAVTTDNPSVMQAFRRKFQESYFWVLTFPCFLHSLNTLIGEICSFPMMKQMISKSTRIVNFFNSSHYWGGQLNGEAKKQGINRKMKQNCESRFYALVLQSMTVLAYRGPLMHTCLRPDAQNRTNNQTPVAAIVVSTVLHDAQYWQQLNQLVKTVKFLVDAIGNLESREVTLADCMLELIRCARQMSQLKLDPEHDDIGFWMHAKSVFNRRFHAINTDLHSFALFLHPMCRKLAVTDASKGRPFEFMVKTALAVAKRWRWGEQRAKLLVDDLKAYNLCRAPFAGGQADGLAWWESLAVSADGHPLKALATTLLSIVPHAANVERLFSDVGGTQSPKRCNLSVDAFETLAKIRANLRYHSHQRAVADGKPVRRRHAHMHTTAQSGIDVDVAADQEAKFTWAPPLAPQTQNIDDDLAGPECISLDEIDAAFALLECEKEAMERVMVDGNEVLQGAVYDFAELVHVDQGLAPKSVDDEIIVVDHTSQDEGHWDVDVLMSSNGVSY